MPSNILANINVVSTATCPASWADITDMSIGSVTVQGTNSVLILMFQAQIARGTDHSAEFRFYVNGSPTGSPILTAFSDHATDYDVNSVTMVWAITGLSGSSNSFSVQWQQVQSTPSMDTDRNRTFQILEIAGGDAEILVNMSASDQVADPATWTNLFDANTIPVAGTGSVLIMIANVPYNMEADERTEFQFEVDGSNTGAITTVYTDFGSEGNGWSGVHVETGLSNGNHDFSLDWRAITGNGQTRAVLRTFQVVEVSANATLKLDLESGGSGSAPGSYGDVTGLSSSYTVASTTAIALIFANIQIVAAADRCADFMIGVDGTEEGAELISYTDSTNLAQRLLLARLKTGLSNASHTFAARWQNIDATPTLDTGRARTLFVIEFTQPTYSLTGITKDNGGSTLGLCECYLVKNGFDNTYSFQLYTISDATGAYTFTGIVDIETGYQVISWKDNSPNVFDVTDHVLTGVAE